jgi:hypothetical protein
MAEESELSLELRVIRAIMGAFKSREVLEAERPEGAPPFDDDRAMLHGWATTVDRQGVILAHLSVVPSTKAELMSRMPGLLNTAPAWLDAHLEGRDEMTAKLFMRGLAQTIAEHRLAIERVMEEQVADREAVEDALAEADVPAGTEEEAQSQLISGVGHAMMAHTKALVEIAYDLESQIRRLTGLDVDDDEDREDDDGYEGEEDYDDDEFEDDWPD